MNRKYVFCTLLLAFFCVTSSYSQRNCGSMEYLDQQIQENPDRIQSLQEIEQLTRQWIKRNENEKMATLVTIPVVFHVVYNTNSENISDAQLATQLQVLNDDFRRLNSDQNNIWAQAADTEIEFCLASIDPNGNATSGITRTSTNVSAFGTNDQVKFNSSGGKDAWPAADYLNFWVCDISGGILGYAQFPGGAAATDGVVCDYQYVGTIGTATAPFHLGRTATHEVGHWLNLRHIWGDGNCNFDDFVTDTPTSDAPNYGCATGHVSCGSTDMVQNYMDYSDDACMNLYTSGQKDRMQALFGNGGSRVGLLSSGGCGAAPNPTCADGIQNGNETGVDCGGPDCPACPACTNITLTINLDNYPEETSWEVLNAGGQTIHSGGTYGSQPDGSTVIVNMCLTDGCYDFVIYDTYGDGICCGYGNGSYSLISGGNVLASGGNFASSQSTNFCLGGGPSPTCTDGVQNGNETGVDCGGPDCPACPTCSDGIQNGSETGVDCGGTSCPACPTCADGVQNGNETGVDCGGPDCAPCGGTGSTTLFGHYFESGWDGWSDGGSDCARYSGSRSWEGNYSIRIRDNSGTASAMTSPTFNASAYSSLEVEFYFYSLSMENGEDFWLRYYDGSGWQTVAAYASGSSFNNNSFYTATVNINSSSYNFPNNAQIRFQCDASGNNDHIYIDAVTVTGLTGAREGNFSTQPEITLLGELFGEDQFSEGIDQVRLYPNPVSDILSLESDELITLVEVYSITGQLVNSSVGNGHQMKIDVKNLNPGLYILAIESDGEMIKQKFVKQ